MKKLNDWTVLWLVFACVTVGFVVGAFWAVQVQPPVQVFQTPVTPATSAPAVPAQVQP